MSASTYFYKLISNQLDGQYDLLEFESVHQTLCVYWRASGASVFDASVGSGGGKLCRMSII